MTVPEQMIGCDARRFCIAGPQHECRHTRVRQRQTRCVPVYESAVREIVGCRPGSTDGFTGAAASASETKRARKHFELERPQIVFLRRPDLTVQVDRGRPVCVDQEM